MRIQQAGSRSCQFCKALVLKQALSFVYMFWLISCRAIIDPKGGVTDPLFSGSIVQEREAIINAPYIHFVIFIRVSYLC